MKREPCRDDERGAYAVLLKKGARALARARPVYWSGIRKYFAGGLTEVDISNLEGILEKVATHFQEANAEGRRRRNGPESVPAVDGAKATMGTSSLQYRCRATGRSHRVKLIRANPLRLFVTELFFAMAKRLFIALELPDSIRRLLAAGDPKVKGLEGSRWRTHRRVSSPASSLFLDFGHHR